MRCVVQKNYVLSERGVVVVILLSAGGDALEKQLFW
jgi:hypothetical protein